MKTTTKTSATIRISGADRRRLIEKAATHLFAKQGFRGTTTKAISARAGVSEAGLYQYFKTKAELYAVILADNAENVSASWWNEIGEYAARNDDENLFRAVAREISEQCRRDAEFMRLMLYSALEGQAQAKLFVRYPMNSICEFLSDYIKRRQRERAFQPCDAEAAARGFVGAQLHSALTKMLSGSDFEDFENASEKESIGDFTKLTVDGLRCGATFSKRYSGIF